MTKNTLPDEMKIACCLTCTLGEPMKDCKICPFNLGLVFKGLELIKQAEQAANVSKIFHYKYNGRGKYVFDEVEVFTG